MLHAQRRIHILCIANFNTILILVAQSVLHAIFLSNSQPKRDIKPYPIKISVENCNFVAIFATVVQRHADSFTLCNGIPDHIAKPLPQRNNDTVSILVRICDTDASTHLHTIAVHQPHPNPQ